MAFPLAAIGAGIGQFAQDYRQQQESALRMLQAQRQMQVFEEEQRQRTQERAAQGAAFRVASQGGFGQQPIQGLPRQESTGFMQPAPGGPNMVPGGAVAGRGNRLPFGQLYQLALDAGFAPGEKARTAAAISMAESGGNPGAINWDDPGGSFGLMQVNAKAHGPDVARSALDPATAFRESYRISRGGRDFSPWSVYKSGAYQRYLGEPILGGDAGTATDIAAGTGQFAMPTNMAAGLGAPRPTGPPDTLVAGGGARPTPDAPTPEGPQPLTVPSATPTDYSRPPPAVAPPPGAAAARPGAATAAPPTDPMAQVQQQVVQGVQQTARITPPSVYGRMGIQGLVQQIEKAMPGADDATKFLALQHAQKLLAPEANMQLELYKEQRHRDWQVEFAKFQHNLRANDPTTGWQVLTDTDGTEYRYNAGSGKAMTLTGNQPYEPKGAQRLGAGGGTASAGAGREAAIATEVRRLDEDWAVANPDATPSQKAAQSFQHRQQAERGIAGAKAAPRADHNIEVRDETSNAVLYRGLATKSPTGVYVKPDGTEVPEGKIVGIGTAQPRTESQMLMGKFLDENPWATAKDAEEWRANRILNESTMRAMGGGIMGRNIVALNTVADHVLRVQEYADALANGQIPRANQVVNTLAKERGLPEVTTFEAGRDIMADEVVRLLTATGGTRGDREGMQSRLQTMMSPEQFAGVFDMLKHMTGGRLDALKQQFARGDPKREQQFDQQMLTPKGRQVWLSLTADRAATLPETSAPGAVPPAPGGAPAPAAPPPRQQRSGTGPPYKAGDIIVKGGRQYRVIGGDPNDPDVEPVQ